jgi:hypothetical protein
MGLVLKLSPKLLVQAQVGLVNQGCGLQGVRRRGAAQLLASRPAKFLVNQRYQGPKRLMVSLAPLGQEFVDFRQVGSWHRPSTRNRSRDWNCLGGMRLELPI